MSPVPWLHDGAADCEVDYGPDGAVVEFVARPATVRKARARAGELYGGPGRRLNAPGRPR